MKHDPIRTRWHQLAIPVRSPSLQRLCSVVAAAGLTGCALVPAVDVPAWDKGDLARPAMQFDADRLEASFGDHIYFSKESASGGRGVGGGGCGCN